MQAFFNLRYWSFATSKRKNFESKVSPAAVSAALFLSGLLLNITAFNRDASLTGARPDSAWQHNSIWTSQWRCVPAGPLKTFTEFVCDRNNLRPVVCLACLLSLFVVQVVIYEPFLLLFNIWLGIAFFLVEAHAYAWCAECCLQLLIIAFAGSLDGSFAGFLTSATQTLFDMASLLYMPAALYSHCSAPACARARPLLLQRAPDTSSRMRPGLLTWLSA